ncbi:hypothetical protein C6P45_001991 [Maudiozyma exigua]|uniref:dolichyl-phosphate-mannose--protein mannosyltransferase n=1 Tax=Maudiozyma exigua TaxID=34358 RepID=A0A9P7BAV9_MAUEX|nr:hypothetical protein C6P45_001991 [Kazachstania exigua]
MSSPIETKAKTVSAPEDDNTVVHDGAQRKYFEVNSYFKKRIGRLNVYDAMIAVFVGLIFPFYMIAFKKDFFSGDFDMQERKLLDLRSRYIKHEFYLSFTGSYALHLLAAVSVDHLRYFSLALASGALFNVYLTLRTAGTDYIFSLIPVVSIAYLPLFQELSGKISIDIAYLYFLTLTIYFWNSLRIQNVNSLGKITRQSFLLSIFIGILVSTKFIGFITWFWVMLVSIIQFWNIISDVTLTTGRIVKITIAKFAFLFTLPIIIFAGLQYQQLINWAIDSPEYSQYMSSYFKTYLRGQEQVPTTVNYGSTIRLRHLNSLGGYLTSYNETYPRGSKEQLVTVSDIEDTEWNLWILEPSDRSDVNENIDESHHIVLRHKMTNKLLRSSAAKPPISEQEYDKEVSCTGDANYTGQRDEYWRFETTKLHEPLRNNLKIQLRDMGQNCQLVSHDIKLTAEWGHNDQEVLCLEPATQKFSTWEIIVIESSPLKIETQTFETFGVGRSTLSFFDKETWKLILEVLHKQFRYDYFIENSSSELQGNKFSQWPFMISDDPWLVHCWNSSVVAIFAYLMWISIQLIKINPWVVSGTATTVPNLRCVLFDEVALEYVVGWLLHYMIFSKSKNEALDIVSYLPSYIFGALLFGCITYQLYKWKHMTVTFWVAYLSFITYKIHK